MPPLEAGYERFVTEPIEVAVGESHDWAQWVGGPLDQDYDVVNISGGQSEGGHHALLYATTEAQEPGFTRLWLDRDQLTTRMMGGVGGEGGAGVSLPPGVVFRVKAGSYLMIQVHYLNATDHVIRGRTYLDLKLQPTDPSHQVASIFAMTAPTVALAAGSEHTAEQTCVVQDDLVFLQLANHMHEYGVSQVTDVIDAEGNVTPLKHDPAWQYHWALSPNLDYYDLDAPRIVPAGSTLRTRCTWNNTSDSEVTFPAEMCVFFGFALRQADVYCIEGNWVAQPE